MIIYIDLLGIPRAEYCERNGVKGIFIPEVPNFRYSPESNFKRGSVPARAMIGVGLYKTNKRSQKYDYLGQMKIFPEYQEIYMASPLSEHRQRHMAYAYNWKGKSEGEEASVSSAADFEKLLSD
ncbi:MAG: hypothetical protein IKH15_09300 [Bacteroidales bacterium]|nr:hypothetical protein [Bacteroidales bacterium]